MLKFLIVFFVIAVGTSAATAQDASSVESSKNHMKALGAAQIGPSFRKKRENERHRREDSDAEEVSLLTDAQKNVEKTGQDLREVLHIHEEAMKKLHEVSHEKVKKAETGISETDVKNSMDALKDITSVEIRSRMSNSVDDEDEEAEDNKSNSKDENEPSSDENAKESIDQESGAKSDELESHSLINKTSEEKSDTHEQDKRQESEESIISKETSEAETDEEIKNNPSHHNHPNEADESTSALPALSFDTSNNLKNLMMESTEVAKELQNVFKVLHDREAKLMEEVIRLQEALTGAVAIVSTKSRSGTHEAIRRCKKKRMARRSRRSTKEDPYKACVYIEPSLPEYSSRVAQSSGEKHKNLTQDNGEVIYPPEPSVRVYFPEESSKLKSEERSSSQEDIEEETEDDNHVLSHEEAEFEENHKKTMSHSSHSSSSSSGESSDDDIDFNRVYWLKLPSDEEGDDEKKMEHKVEEVISEVKEDGKDALIIPVARGFNHTHPGNSNRGFLTALNPNPALKKKLRRHIRRSLQHSKKDYGLKHKRHTKTKAK